ncbi:MAG TPA: hypothetical protein VNJ53_01000 [Gaiellaceae bacterium]|nr:hypothetical protein [Gaiellaceae bacterium]
MSKSRIPVPSPATALALAALFFAFGGSAFALGERMQSAAVAQQRCTNGAVRGVATVVGPPGAGIANVPDRFTATRSLFSRRFNCTGKAVQVRRVSTGVFEVRFVGNTAQTALASAVGNALVAVEAAPEGAFRVSIHPAGRDDLVDAAFSIVAV